MTRAAKITYACSLLLGFLVGFFLGFRQTAEILPSQEEARTFSASESLLDFARAQFRYAKADEAAKSLLLCATLLERLRQRDPGADVKDSFVEIYVRLALLADRRNDDEDSRAYMAQAQQALRSPLARRPTSDAELKDHVSAIDRFDESVGR